jgi:hypothetical protein
MKNETWKNIYGYTGRYKISNLGRVKSLKRKTKFGNRIKVIPEKILKIQYGATGYPIIQLGISNTKIIHRLVAMAFISNKKRRKEVNHIDGNKKNNCVENLEWVTPMQNTIHYWKHINK